MGSIIRKCIFAIYKKQLDDLVGKQHEFSNIPNVQADCSIAYGDSPEEMYDYIYPSDVSELKKLPLIINVHGGAFTSGDKALNRQYAQWLASKGYQVAVLNYSYVPQVNIMEQLVQVMKAAKLVIERYCASYEPDSENCTGTVYFTGDSSGSFIVSLLICLWDIIARYTANTASADGMRFEELPELLRNNSVIQDYVSSGITESVKLCAAGLICPPCTYDLFPKLMMPFLNENRRLLFEGCEQLADTFILKKMWSNTTCPVCIITFNKDVFYKKVVGFVKWLRSNGYKCKIAEAKAAKTPKSAIAKTHKLYHCFNVIQPDLTESIELNEKMLRFFKKND